MKIFNFQLKILLIPVAFFILTIISTAVASEEKIVFLQFKIDSNSITLTKSILADGQLKNSRSNESNKEFYFEVVSSDSKIISSGSIENPLVRNLEYENPDKPGELILKIINLETAEFTVRVNYDLQIDKINFYRAQDDENSQSSKSRENLIGSVSLTSLHGGENE